MAALFAIPIEAAPQAEVRWWRSYGGGKKLTLATAELRRSASPASMMGSARGQKALDVRVIFRSEYLLSAGSTAILQFVRKGD
jgi:hypothetical protein